MANKNALKFHLPALRENETKHGVLLDMLVSKPLPGMDVDFWSLGESPGACAARLKPRWRLEPDRSWSIVLGDIDEMTARNLAETMLNVDYPGVVGPDLTAQWFGCRAAELGVQFREIEPLQFWRLEGPVAKPRIPGYAKQIQMKIDPNTFETIPNEDIDLFKKWLVDFTKESSPYLPVPTEDEAEALLEKSTWMFWIDNGEIVSMAGTTRWLEQTAAITGVYTPPEFRGRGYAAAITAITAEFIQEQGKTATLFTDLRVPASNRCYKRIGFRGIHTGLHFHC